MQKLEQAFAGIHPSTLLGALTYLALAVVVGVLGTLAIHSAANRVRCAATAWITWP